VLPGGSDPAKYKNSAESPIYSKRRTLYALNWAKQDIIASDEVVVCEGYTDVIGMFEAGIERAVATCGTALGEEHVVRLRSFASRVVLAFDADGAGQSAAGRFYEWERRFEIDVAVADLPPGSDPGDLARSDPDALRSAVENAKPFLQFRLTRILDGADLSTPEGRARAADNALAAVAEHPDNLVRDQYLMQVAERCRLEPLLLRERLDELRAAGGPQTRRPVTASGRRRAEQASASGGGDPWVRDPEDEGDDDFDGGRVAGLLAEGTNRRLGRDGGQGAEFRPGLEALRLVIHRWADVEGQLEPALFSDDLQRITFQSIIDAGGNLHEAADSAPPEVRALLVRLAVEEPRGEVDEVVLQLVRDAARRQLRQVTGEARTSPSAVEEAAAAAAWVQELDDPGAAAAATARLVAWLVVRAQTSTAGRAS
jgi:DNA primase